MNPLRRVSIIELTKEHLRSGLQSGRWLGNLPGVPSLSKEFDVSQHTVRAALLQLEAEGLLGTRGLGRSRSIDPKAGGAVAPMLRVGILCHDARIKGYSQTSEVLCQIIYALGSSGHTVFLCKKSQIELQHDVPRIAREMAKTPADAWVIEAGSFPLLEWCAAQSTPYHALYGRFNKLPLAGTGLNKVPAFRAATRHLIELGHRRIVFIVDEARCKPTPGINTRAFLEELSAHGVSTGIYNLPDWEASPAGFYELLDRLFRYTAPTALIIDEAARYVAAAEYLARRGINVPRQVSLISTDDDSAFAFCNQSIALMRWDNAPIVRRVVRWVEAVRKGKPDRKSINVLADYVPGGSIGPVWQG
jgi:DNA-binding LacI/PurR family transcriptional regulator